MKVLPFILMFALIGCVRRDNPATQMSRQIQRWVPAGTSLAAARQIMEQHHFTCTVDSYDSKAAMPPGADTIRWDTGIFRNGRFGALTNLSLLNCSHSHTNGGVFDYEATLTVLNGETDGGVGVSADRIK